MLRSSMHLDRAAQRSCLTRSTRPAECLQYCEAGGSNSALGKQARERGRRLAIGGKREHTGTGLQAAGAPGSAREHGARAARCPPMPSSSLAAARLKAEGAGSAANFPWIHVACQQGADAVEIRIARGEHADGASAMLQHFLYGAFEWAGPWPRRAANERCRKREVASAAKYSCLLDELGVPRCSTVLMPSSPMPTMDSRRNDAAVSPAL